MRYFLRHLLLLVLMGAATVSASGAEPGPATVRSAAYELMWLLTMLMMAILCLGSGASCLVNASRGEEGRGVSAPLALVSGLTIAVYLVLSPEMGVIVRMVFIGALLLGVAPAIVSLCWPRALRFMRPDGPGQPEPTATTTDDCP